MPSNHSNFYCSCKVITLNPLCASFLVLVFCFFFNGFLSKVITLSRSFSLLKALAIRLPLLIANAFKSVKERQLLLAIVGKAINIWDAIQKRSQSDNFCYRKVGRSITKWGAAEKSPILPFLKDNKNYFAF